MVPLTRAFKSQVFPRLPVSGVGSDADIDPSNCDDPQRSWELNLYRSGRLRRTSSTKGMKLSWVLLNTIGHGRIGRPSHIYTG